MEQRFNCNKNELTQSRITFWFYAISFPIIVGLFAMMIHRAGGIGLNLVTIVCGVIVLYLLFSTYRAFRVMMAIGRSCCMVSEDRVSGIGMSSPYGAGVPFDIARSEILGIGKKTVPVGGMRAYNALVLNTAKEKIVLLAIERPEELSKLLRQETTKEEERNEPAE